MAYGQCLVLVLEAVCVRLNTSRASIGAVFLVFVYEACFTWGQSFCLCLSLTRSHSPRLDGDRLDIPPRDPASRAPCKGRGACSRGRFPGKLCGSFSAIPRTSVYSSHIYVLQVVQITPPAIHNIGYKTYIIFAIFNFVNAYIVWAFYPETAGLTLESVDDLFRRDDSETPAGTHKSRLQWSVVSKAAATVERVKKDRAAGVEGGVQSGLAREKNSVDSTEVVEAKN